MKKFITITFVLLVGIVLGSIYFHASVTMANPSVAQVVTNETSNGTSTSTANYMSSATASTTLAFDPQNANLLHVHLAVYSTSTPAVVDMGMEFSNNNTDWYPYETGTAAYPKTLNSGAVGDIWHFTASTSTANETVFKSFTLGNNFAAKYGRVVYHNSGGAASVHVELNAKKEF